MRTPSLCSSMIPTRSPPMRRRSTCPVSTSRIMATTARSRRCCAVTISMIPCCGRSPRRCTKQTSLIIAAVVAGTVLASLLIGRYADHVGRRRCYVLLYVLLACVGVAFAVSSAAWLLILFALTGALSTEVVESGPFTSLEQSMLATELSGDARLRGFGTYNAVASAAGSLGALAAGGLSLLDDWWPDAPADGWFFLVFVPVALAGAAVAGSLSDSIEVTPNRQPHLHARQRLGPSRPIVIRLAGLFALDSFGGGFVVQAFVAYWLAQRFGASLGTVGV